MKKIVLLILLCSGGIAYGQKSYQFDFNQTPLSDVLKELTAKHKIKFSYNPTLLAPHTLTGKVKANSEAELISKLIDGFPFKIQLADGVYLLIPQRIIPIAKTLTGQVYDKNSGEPLAFAHVQTDKRGTYSNQDGRFSFPPREDTITLKVSYIGYKPLELKIPPEKESILLDLEQNPTILQEVILNSSTTEELATKPSFFSLNPNQFSALPALGEVDVFKSIQLLPGVRATDETSSGLSIRGSLPSQNLILMDGFTLYNLDHFFGIYSTINPNMINNVSVFKGGFGAEYGGRTSSVIDVTRKNGTTEQVSGGAGLNMLSGNLFLQAPISKKTSLIFGTRQSFTEIINSTLYEDFLTSNRKSFLQSVDSEIAALELTPSLKFYDLNGKLQHRFSNRSVLDLNLFVSEDFYQGDFIEGDSFSSFNVNDKSEWANAGISVDWKHQASDRWFTEVIIGASEFKEEERLAINQTFFEDASFNTDSIYQNTTVGLFDYQVYSSIGDLTIKSINEIEIDDKNLLKTGMELSNISTTYNTDILFFQSFNANETYYDSLTTEASVNSFYLSHQLTTEDFTTNIGIRASHYDIAGRWFFEPRFNVGFKVSDRISLKGAATFHHQFISQTSLSPFQNTDQFYWILANDEAIPVQKSTHFILGGNYQMNKWTIDLEYYQKNTEGILENQFLTLPTDVIRVQAMNLGFTPDFDNLSGENTSEGLDFFLKYRSKLFTSWLSYSIGSSQNQFLYINNNDRYPSVQDQRHEINFSAIMKLGKWELSGVLLYGSGKPYTPTNPGFDLVSDSIVYDYSRINGARLPSYQRLDVSAKYTFAIGKLTCETGITLFNVLNRKNIKSRRYTVQYIFDENPNLEATQDEARAVALDTPLLGFTPNFFFTLRF